MDSKKISHNGAYLKLPWKTLCLKGSDVIPFLQGQTTNDVKKLSLNQIQISALVDLSGRLETFFYLQKLNDAVLLFLTPADLEKTKIRLEKYLITEDVEMSVLNDDVYLYLGYEAYAFSAPNTELARGFFYGVPGFLSREKVSLQLPELAMDELTGLVIESGIGRLGQEVESGKLINETFLEETGISYNKGCFLGQETVAKVHNFRGPAYYPVKLVTEASNLVTGAYKIQDKKAGEIKTFLTINGETYAYASMLREFRLDGAKLELELASGEKIQATVKYYNYKIMTDMELAQSILEEASKIFTHENNSEKAKHLLRLGIIISPESADLYESLGVIFGREEKYQEAIELMDKLSQISPDSVMAYTNKSLYLMKIGKIEEAEAAKAQATLKSFAYYGNEAKKKAEAEEREKKARADQERREMMFRQVLEIDPEDTLANFGLGEISFEKGLYPAAIELVRTTLKADPKYSVAYLLLGKCYEGLGDKLLAKETYQKGIPVATAKGDMMPANEMQTRLSKLN